VRRKILAGSQEVPNYHRLFEHAITRDVGPQRILTREGAPMTLRDICMDEILDGF
jgi:hypothetical protein